MHADKCVVGCRSSLTFLSRGYFAALFFLCFTALISATPADAVIKQCCPEGLESVTISGSGSVWTATSVHTFTGQYIQATGCSGGPYSVAVTLKLFYTSQPTTCSTQWGNIAHEGNSLCNPDNASNRPPCVKADCLYPPEKQVLAYLWTGSGFDKTDPADIQVSSATSWSPSTPTSPCIEHYKSQMEAIYEGAFSAGTWDSCCTSCSVLRGVTCNCGSGGSNCS
ncbi:MAG: hypothetical protein GEEBNDBF_00691 [bacterium]|nr:hypothetical protein [bacterium]